MNKSLLIIICDFLLISLLASFDLDSPNSGNSAITSGEEAQSAKDMLDALNLALEEEQKNQASLTAKLTDLKEDLSATRTILKDREDKLETVQDSLAETERRAKELETQRSRLEQEFESTQKNFEFLQQQYLSTKAEAGKLKSSLASTSKTAAVSKAKLETIQAELTVRHQEAVQMQAKIEDLEKERRANEAEKFNLALDLKQSQTEVIVTKEHLAASRDDIKAARADSAFARQVATNALSEIKIARTEAASLRDEKNALQQHAYTLATGISNLAEKSEQIKDEIRSNRPLTANAIFDQFRNNQIDTRFFAAKSGLFGQRTTRERNAKSILVNDGKRYYLLYHIDDTPLSLVTTDANWEQLTGVVSRGSVSYSIPMLDGLAMDPRILVVLVGRTQAERLGSKIYQLATDPYKFQDAVLVGSRESYFGEVGFQADPNHMDYVMMKRRTLGKLFGKFSPSRGDLVFSKIGELLGIMVNNKYCAVFRNIHLSGQIKFGTDISETETAKVLGQMHNQFQVLPFHLQ
ncbi:MAG: Chromosome partition protein Smc [Verrucomicrobia subdivision 3 bacterium]|nr:Chromosome partition protein Smc [Limisphaerales bacterium]MCS1417649.1 Chromosome partition protein Smc [Limisphaerales bacterium]